MKTSCYSDFIGVYTNVFDNPDFCDFLIDEFEGMSNYNNGVVMNRRENEGELSHSKSDSHSFLNVTPIYRRFEGETANYIINKSLFEMLSEYIGKYSVLTDISMVSTEIKMQKTAPGEGYHLWHMENENIATSGRVLVYAIYLNDIKPQYGGETEYLYQRRRVNPVKNTAAIWPAGFTHTHRGNTNLSDHNKYILTGWFYYNQ